MYSNGLYNFVMVLVKPQYHMYSLIFYQSKWSIHYLLSGWFTSLSLANCYGFVNKSEVMGQLIGLASVGVTTNNSW